MLYSEAKEYINKLNMRIAFEPFEIFVHRRIQMKKNAILVKNIHCNYCEYVPSFGKCNLQCTLRKRL